MFKCPFCENFVYDWNDEWGTEKKTETVKQVSEHVNSHPESKPTSFEKVYQILSYTNSIYRENVCTT